VAVAVPGTTFLGDSNWRLSTRLIVRAGLPAGWDSNPDPWQAWLDARVVGATPILRTRRAGDRFQPLGMGGHAKLLAELFTNAKILPATRDHWPLLATARGEIAWVCGLRVDERAKVTQDTAQVLHVKLAIEAHESENG
jgi:tRNA(Ile)-lysidine synthase